tara:strand:- start:387 stop:584 length:198 start_codon:yes stop_codon:yes gene_type:complete
MLTGQVLTQAKISLHRQFTKALVSKKSQGQQYSALENFCETLTSQDIVYLFDLEHGFHKALQNTK